MQTSDLPIQSSGEKSLFSPPKETDDLRNLYESHFDPNIDPIYYNPLAMIVYTGSQTSPSSNLLATCAFL